MTTNIDFLTIVVYVIMALLTAYIARKALWKYEISIQNGCSETVASRQYWSVAIVGILFLTSVATFRMVGIKIGGTDTLDYIRTFLSIGSIKEISWLSEPLFRAYLLVIRYCTSNYRWFFFTSYLIISISYFAYIKEYGSAYYSSIPYLVIALFFLKDFSSVRTGLAIALITFGLVNIEKRRILSIILMVSAILVHRMSILFVLVYLFYFLFKNVLAKISKIKLITFVVTFIVLSIALASQLQNNFKISSILDSTDTWYVLRNRGKSLLSRWPMLFAHIMLMVVYLLMRRFENKDEKNSIEPVIIVFSFDIIILPMALTLGIYRENEFFFLNRLILWGYVVSIGNKLFSRKSRWTYRIIVLILFAFWFVFRLFSEGPDLGIMYYRFAW